MARTVVLDRREGHDARCPAGAGELAIERGGRWVYRPRSTRTLEADDRLLVVGPEESAPRLRARVGDDRPEHDEHGWTEPELDDD